MFAALTILPAMIGGTGNFIDGVLHEFDTVAAFASAAHEEARFTRSPATTGVQPRPRAKARAQAAPRAPKFSLGALVAHGAQRRPVVAAGLRDRAADRSCRSRPLNLRVGSADAGTDPKDATTYKAYDLIAAGLREGTNGPFQIVAELAAEGRQGRAGAADRRRGQARHDFTRRPPVVRPTARSRRSRPTRGPGPRTRRPRPRSIACATTCPRRRARHATGRRRWPHRRQRGLHEGGGRQAAVLRRHRRAAQRAVAAGRLPLGLHPDQGRGDEPAVDRRVARLRHARSSRRASAPTCSASARARSSRSCR